MKYTTFVGLGVHKDSIAVAVARRNDKDAEELGVTPNSPQAIAKLVRKLGEPKSLRFCYEAGPCGYGIYRQLIAMGSSCMVVAPSLVPRKPGERVKTDRRDAKKLARLLRSGELTPGWVPDEHKEALRDLLRAREDACQDLLRKRHQLGKFLMRLGVMPPAGIKAWTDRHRRWLQSIRFDEPAQRTVLAEYLHEVEEVESRIERLEREIAAYVEAFADGKVIKKHCRHLGSGPHYCSNPGSRARRHHSVRDPEAAYVICWPCAERILEWWERASRSDHKER